VWLPRRSESGGREQEEVWTTAKWMGRHSDGLVEVTPRDEAQAWSCPGIVVVVVVEARP
jgi:hypothetical protein